MERTSSDNTDQQRNSARSQSAKSGAGETLYVCPMHPQERQDHPGKCSICGMDLKSQART